MSKNQKAAAAPAAAAEEVAVDTSAATYDVTLNARFTFMDFAYMPNHHHVVDQTIYEAMRDAGAIADVKQLS